MVVVLNPRIDPDELAGKFIVLDLLAEDAAGRRYNIEMQVRRYNTCFEHWQDEPTMAAIAYPSVQQALEHIKALSADDETRRFAFVRERASYDEVSELRAAREMGKREGKLEGLEEALARLIQSGMSENHAR